MGWAMSRVTCTEIDQQDHPHNYHFFRSLIVHYKISAEPEQHYFSHYLHWLTASWKVYFITHYHIHLKSWTSRWPIKREDHPVQVRIGTVKHVDHTNHLIKWRATQLTGHNSTWTVSAGSTLLARRPPSGLLAKATVGVAHDGATAFFTRQLPWKSRQKWPRRCYFHPLFEPSTPDVTSSIEKVAPLLLDKRMGWRRCQVSPTLIN